MSIDLNKMTRSFILGEGKSPPPSIEGYLQAISESLEGLNPKTLKELRKVTMSKLHVREVKKLVKRMNEKVKVLEEQVKILEESKGNAD